MPIKIRAWKILTLFPLIAAPVLLWPQKTLAIDLIGFATEGIFNMMLTIVDTMVNWVGWVLISLAGSIVNYAFRFPNFIKAPVVQIGWTLSRDIANMLFILVLLGIAFAYILRLDIFGVKNLLPKLIIMALLLNFSLIVCGVFIDMGNSLGRFFVSGGETVDVGNNIMAAVKAGQLAQLRNGVAGDSPVTSLFMASAVQLIFYLILAFLLFALGLMMIYRIVHLWLLIILAPLAWICIAVPKMGGYYSKWWTSFLQWSFFPAVMGFFIFLGVLTGSTFMGSDMTAGVGEVSGWQNILPSTFLSAIMQFIVVVFILFIGLTTSQKWGITGAETMMKHAKSVKDWGLGKVKVARKAAGGAALLATKIGADKILGRTPLGGLAQIQERMEKVPGLGRAIGGPGARFQRQQKELKDAEGKLKNLRPQDLRAILNQVALTPEGQARRAAALSQLADKGQLKDEDKKYIPDFQAAGGNLNDIIKKRLDWALDERIQQIMASDLNNPKMAGDWSKVTAEKESTKRLEVAKKLIRDEYIPKKPGELADIQKDAVDAKESDKTKEKKKVLRLNTERSIDQLDKQTKDIQEVIKAEKSKGDKANNNFITAQENTIKNIEDQRKMSTNEYLRKLEELEQEEAKRLERENQKIIRELILDEFKEEGRLYAASLNSLAGKNPGAYQELAINYLKYQATGMREDLKKDVYRHLISGPMAAIAEEASSPPATPAPSAPAAGITP